MTRTLSRRLTACAVAGGLLAAGLLGAAPAEAATATGTATAGTALRSSASASGAVVGTLQRGQKIPTAAAASHGWVRVSFRHATAFVAASALTTRTTGLPPAPTKLKAGTKIATARLNVRSRPASSGSLVGRIAAGSVVKVSGAVRSGYAPTSFGGKTRWVSARYLATAAPRLTATADAGAAALAYARAQLGKPYQYGATGPNGFDCSGLTLRAWEAAGVTLPRTSLQQFAVGTGIAKADLRPGDLVFFYTSKPTHVALYVGDGVIIHAPRTGRDVEYSKLAYMPFSGARRPG